MSVSNNSFKMNVVGQDEIKMMIDENKLTYHEIRADMRMFPLMIGNEMGWHYALRKGNAGFFAFYMTCMLSGMLNELDFEPVQIGCLIPIVTAYVPFVTENGVSIEDCVKLEDKKDLDFKADFNLAHGMIFEEEDTMEKENKGNN